MTPCVASQPLLQEEEYDERRSPRPISKAVFPRDERGRAYFPPGWVAGMLEETATEDLWKLAPKLKATKVRTTLPPDTILELFKERRLAGSHIHRFTFIECEMLGDASPFIERYATSFNQKGKKVANVFDGETFPSGTQFKLKVIAPRIFEWHIQTLLEIGGIVKGIGPSALRRKGLGRFRVLEFKRVST